MEMKSSDILHFFFEKTRQKIQDTRKKHRDLITHYLLLISYENSNGLSRKHLPESSCRRNYEIEAS